MISLFLCWKKAPASCRYSWPTLVINSSWFDNLLGGLSGPAKTLHCIAPYCPIGFTLQLGLCKSQRDQDPTLTLSLSFSPTLPRTHTNAHAHAHTCVCFSLFSGFAPTHCSRSEKLIYKSSLLREEIQAAIELAPQLCLYHDDMSVHVFLCWVKLLASVNPSCRGSEHRSENICHNDKCHKTLC